MKTITKLFIELLLVTVIISCNKNDDAILPSNKEVIENYGEFLAKDSINYFRVISTKSDSLQKCNRSNNQIIWSTSIIEPPKQTVDIGYGVTDYVYFNHFGTIFEGDMNLCFITYGRGNKYEYAGGTNIGVYSQRNGSFLNNISIVYPNYFLGIMRWSNNRFVLLLGSNENSTSYTSLCNKYIMIGVDGNIDGENNTKLIYGNEDPFMLNEYQYVAIQNKTLFICDLRSGSTKLSDLTEYYKSKYPNESHAPLLTISLKGYDNNLLNVDVKIVFYSGLTTTEHLYINTITKEITQGA